MPDYHLTGNLTERVEKAFYARCLPEERPAFIRESADASANVVATDALERPSTSATPGDKKQSAANHDANLAYALHNVFWLQWWTAGACMLIAGTCSELESPSEMSDLHIGTHITL